MPAKEGLKREKELLFCMIKIVINFCLLFL